MKTRFTQKFLMAFLMLGLFTTSQAQTYVNSAASGANDGSSWADAYTDLSAALGAATSGDIWIAAGTYVPADAGLDTFNTFLVMNPVSIYGGFAGTEASIDDRVEGNVTILSGDVAGDDMDNVFTSNKEDNLFHVMTIDVGATDVVVLDGLSISGGFASDDNGPDDSYVWAGAGVYSVSTVEATNCHFSNNSCASGAGLYLTGDASDSKIDNCLFEKGQVVNQAAGCMANTLDKFTATNCEFRDNITARGALYPLRVSDLFIDNCTFTNNQNNGGFGGAMFIWNSVGTVQNCTFTGNSSGNAGCFYYDGRELPAGVNSLVVDNCTFNDNVATGAAGAIFGATASYTVSNSSFTGNSAAGSGGAVLDLGDGIVVNQINNTYKNNSGNFGGANNTQSFGTFIFTGNTYDSNSSAATAAGSCISSAFNAQVELNDCFFEDNTGDRGVLYIQGDTATLTINESQFVGNTGATGAGVISMNGASDVTINKSYFEGNTGDFGGVIGGSEKVTFEVSSYEATIDISKSIFRENFAGTQGAAISAIDFDVNITNSEFSSNINQGEGAGGALSLNATDTSTVSVNIVNSTLVSNFGVIGAGIATFTGEVDSKLNVTLTNTILANPDGNNYEVEGGTPKFSSNGGNISTDATTEATFTNTNDFNEIDAEEIFTEIDELDYTLSGASIAIDNGVEAGVTDDIYSRERIGSPDSGCWEAGVPTSTEVLENNGQLTMTPNPAATVSTITVDNAWNGTVNITVTDMTGKVVANQNVTKTAQAQDFNLNVSELSVGNYILTLRAENAVVSTQFIKI